MSSIVSIDTRGYDISMGPGFLRVGGGGGIAGNVYINGNVGIRTANPGYPLDVSGELRVGSGVGGLINIGRSGTVASYRTAYINSTSTDLYILNQQPGAFQFGTNNDEKMRITASGNVGIGTATPNAKLEVSGTLRINSAFTLNSSGLTNANYIIFSNNTNAYAIQQIDNAGANYFRMGRNGFGDIAISSTGNVGIGTEAPLSKLHVVGAIPTSNTNFNNMTAGLKISSTGDRADGMFLFINPNGSDYNNAISCIQATIDANNQANTIYRPLSLNPFGGSVGIGTTTPGSTLDVNGTVTASTIISSGGISAVSAMTCSGTNGGVRLLPGYDSGTKYSGYVEFFSANATRLGFFGNIPYNTSNLGTGDIQLQVENSTTGFALTGSDRAVKSTTSTWLVSSDRRIKEDITDADLDLCYSVTKNLKLRRFKWKDYVGYEHDKHVVGYIAQEVKDVFPKAVTQSKNILKKKNENGEIVQEEIEDFLSLNVDQIQKTLHGAIQKLIINTEQQQTQIEQLQNQNQTQQTLLEQLQQRIQALENK